MRRVVVDSTVRAGRRPARVSQHFGDAAHAYPADADEVHATEGGHSTCGRGGAASCGHLQAFVSDARWHPAAQPAAPPRPCAPGGADIRPAASSSVHHCGEAARHWSSRSARPAAAALRLDQGSAALRVRSSAVWWPRSGNSARRQGRPPALRSASVRRRHGATTETRPRHARRPCPSSTDAGSARWPRRPRALRGLGVGCTADRWLEPGGGIPPPVRAR